MNMKKILPVVFVAVLLVFPSGKAYAKDTRTCISTSEFTHAKTGMRRIPAENEFEVRGFGIPADWFIPYSWIYPRCGIGSRDLADGYYGFSFAPRQGLWWRIECIRTADGPCYTGYNRGGTTQPIFSR